jgi:hypothetical protein
MQLRISDSKFGNVDSKPENVVAIPKTNVAEFEISDSLRKQWNDAGRRFTCAFV